MATRLLLCLMLCCIAVPAMAREAAMLSAGGSCAVSQDEAADAAEATRGPADKRAVQATPAMRTAPPQRRGGEAEAATRPPRWHSFLPGMFR